MTDRPYHVAVALALIDSNHCACSGCNGRLRDPGESDWRHCNTCGCQWKPDVIQHQRYAVMVRDQRCATSTGGVRSERLEHEAA